MRYEDTEFDPATDADREADPFAAEAVDHPERARVHAEGAL